MRYIILLILLSSAFILKGQEFEGRIELYGDQYIVSDAITINESENFITFQSNIDYDLKDFEKSKIRSIQRKEGNYFLTGLLIGAAAGPLFYHYVRGYDNFTSESFMITNLIGIAIGTTFGLLTNRYSQVYGDLDTRLAVLDKIEVMPGTFQFKLNLLSYNLNLD
jgi:hypothetical protein